jgi:hypothetical protein
MSPQSRTATLGTIQSMGELGCDAVCLTARGCSPKEVLNVLRHARRPLGVYVTEASARTAAFFRGRDVLMLVSTDSLHANDLSGRLDPDKLRRLVLALTPPPAPLVPTPKPGQPCRSIVGVRERVGRV